MLAPKAMGNQGSAPMDKAGAKVKEASMAKDDPAREARLAAALRANLRRRKAQAREQVEAEPGEAEQPPSDRHRHVGSVPASTGRRESS